MLKSTPRPKPLICINCMTKKQKSFDDLVKSGFTELQATELIDMIYEIFRFDMLERTKKLMAAGFTEAQAQVLIEVTYTAKGWELPKITP